MKVRIIGVLIIVIAFLVYLSVYTVEENQRAVLFKLGELEQTNIQPGLHFKWPFIDKVIKLNHQLLTLRSRSNQFKTSDNKSVLVGFLVKWDISNIKQYFHSTQGNMQQAENRLSQILKEGLGSHLNKLTLKEIITGGHDLSKTVVSANAQKIAKQLGVRVKDMRIVSVNLPSNVAKSVYKRMESQRARIAARYRAHGKDDAEKIRAKADSSRSKILANAYRQSQKLRGQGDAMAAEIYAKAYNKNPQFYAFYRSLQAYRQVFDNGNNVLVLGPTSQFFRYFNQSEGNGKK